MTLRRTNILIQYGKFNSYPFQPNVKQFKTILIEPCLENESHYLPIVMGNSVIYYKTFCLQFCSQLRLFSLSLSPPSSLPLSTPNLLSVSLRFVKCVMVIGAEQSFISVSANKYVHFIFKSCFLLNIPTFQEYHPIFGVMIIIVSPLNIFHAPLSH